MLKWAVTPRFNGEFFEQDGIYNTENCQLLTLENIINQHELPCLVRLINDDINESIDNYCLLLSKTVDPYLIVSNEPERFSVPLSFDGFFAPVERGFTRYNVLNSIRALQPHLKTSSPTSTSLKFTHFTTLQSCATYGNSTSAHVQAGSLLEPCRKSLSLSSSPSPSISSSSTSSSSHRLRTFFAHLPYSFNKHVLSNSQQANPIRSPISPYDYFDVKSTIQDEIFTLKYDSIGSFVPVYTQLPSKHSHHRSIFSSQQIQGLYTTNLLSKLIDQYPLITELIISRSLEENVPKTAGYPFRRITLHRLVENHPRVIAFDMKNYAFVELDIRNSSDIYIVEHDTTLIQRYQAQLRWCQKHLSSFRSQIKTIVRSLYGLATFIQATPLQDQQLQQYHQHRSSSDNSSSPLMKHIPQTIFTTQELPPSSSTGTNRFRTHTPISSKFHTTSNHMKYDQKQKPKGKTMNSNGIIRKDVRVYFNDPTIQKHLLTKRLSNNINYCNYRMDSADSDNIDDDKDNEQTFHCTAL